jgi:hypothetical protein
MNVVIDQDMQPVDRLCADRRTAREQQRPDSNSA